MKSNCDYATLDAGGAVKFGRAKLKLSCLIALATAFLSSSMTQAQAMREVTELPRDCTQFIPLQAKGTLQPWQVFVGLEHCDRMKRLRKLSDTLPPDQRPRFYEGVVPASRLPDSFGTDLPVLRVVFPDRTFFDTGRYVLRREARHVASIVAESLRREPPDVAMFVAGHADTRGAEDDNEVLSENRADAVASAIYGMGVNLTSLWRIGFGEDMPLHDGENEYDHAKNRRVEFLFAARPEAVATWLADQQFDELCQSSVDADATLCRENLKFRAGYDAVVVNPQGKQIARPKDYVPPAVDRKKVRPTRSSQTVSNPTPGRKTIAKPQNRARAEVIPANTRKIRINPVNPDSKPVTVIL
jgi:outer membrane protein OmpA-like peptidoglycan-associated protein